MRLDDFYRPVQSLTDAELVEQTEILTKLLERRRRRESTDDETARRLIASLDEPDEP